jgi:hypothetical protein
MPFGEGCASGVMWRGRTSLSNTGPLMERLSDSRSSRRSSSASTSISLSPATPPRPALQRQRPLPSRSLCLGDPVADGLVVNLARPGGNVTGMTFLGPELATKRLELLKQALPAVSRVAALWHPGAYGESTMRQMMGNMEAAAGALLVRLQLVEVRSPGEFDSAFMAMAREQAEALIVLPSPMLFSERRHIVDLATRRTGLITHSNHLLRAMFEAFCLAP